MKKYTILVKSLAAVALLSLFLTSCTSGEELGNETPDVSPTPATSPAVGEVPTYPVPLENRRGVTGACPSSQADGYYRVGDIVTFCDVQAGGIVALCAQPGCEHKDESCQAWVGDVKSYTEYHGDIYAVRGNYDVDFVRKDLTDGSITVLAEWKATDITYYSACIGQVSDGRATLGLSTCVRKEKDSPDVDEEYTIWLIDLETGEKEQLTEIGENGGVLAHSRQYLLVDWVNPEQPDLLSEEEFLEEYGEGLSWARYLHRARDKQLRLYDCDTGEYQVLTSTQQGYYPTSGSPWVYGMDAVYVEGDGVFLVNVEKGQTRQLLTMEGIINYWIMDHRVFLITSEGDKLDPNQPIKVWYTDMEGGELVQLDNDGNTHHAVFGMMAEGESFFLGQMGLRLSKQDFYAENYENAV